jgi:phosphatidylglycerophosphate synthase
LADKIGIGVYAVLVAWTGDIPVWFVVFILLRDILIFSGGVYIQRSKKIIPQSNWPGKIAVTLVALVLFLGTIQINALSTFFWYALWTSIVMMMWSVVTYAQRLFIGRHIEPVK